MAGLSGPQAVIDVVAAAEKLRPSPRPKRQRASRVEASAAATVPAEPDDLQEAAPPAAAGDDLSYLAEEEAHCALGHPNHRDYRFCASCGIPMSASAPPSGSPMQARPRPAGELSDAERAERDRQHAAALAAASRFEQAVQEYVPPAGESVLIHFVADGLTAFGQVWYRGQELEIGPAHPRWPEARGWITLSRFQQVERWGEQKFDFGPWPGRRSYTDALGSFEQLGGTDAQGNKVTFAGPSEAELRAADEAEQRRARGVPAPAFR